MPGYASIPNWSFIPWISRLFSVFQGDFLSPLCSCGDFIQSMEVDLSMSYKINLNYYFNNDLDMPWQRLKLTTKF